MKQTGVPLGFALSGAIVPPLASWLGWQGAAQGLATVLVIAIVALQLFAAELEGGAPEIVRPARSSRCACSLPTGDCARWR